MIEVIGVTKRFQDFTAIQNLSLKVSRRSPEFTGRTRARSKYSARMFLTTQRLSKDSSMSPTTSISSPTRQ